MAHKKAGGSTRNGRDSNPKYLGIKRYGGQLVNAGEILLRQRGTKFHPGMHVGIGRDHTLFALKPGRVVYGFKGALNKRCVSIELLEKIKQEVKAAPKADAKVKAAPKATKTTKAKPKAKKATKEAAA